MMLITKSKIVYRCILEDVDGGWFKSDLYFSNKEEAEKKFNKYGKPDFKFFLDMNDKIVSIEETKFV